MFTQFRIPYIKCHWDKCISVIHTHHLPTIVQIDTTVTQLYSYTVYAVTFWMASLPHQYKYHHHFIGPMCFHIEFNEASILKQLQQRLTMVMTQRKQLGNLEMLWNGYEYLCSEVWSHRNDKPRKRVASVF